MTDNTNYGKQRNYSKYLDFRKTDMNDKHSFPNS